MTYRARFVGLLVLVLCSAVPAISHAQESYLGILEYLDDPLEVSIISPDGTETEPFIGLELEGGTVIQTYESTAEIRLKNTGSLLRLAEGSIFRLEGPRLEDNVSVSAFSLAAGTIRCVAARVSGQGYAVHTQSAVLGIRGTDFIVELVSNAELLHVLDGSVETLHRVSGRSRLVETGYSMDVADEDAEPGIFDEELRDLLVRMNSFRTLDPLQVVHQEGPSGDFDLSREAEKVSTEDLETLMEEYSGADESGGRVRPADRKKDDSTGQSESRDGDTRLFRRDKPAGDKDWAFILSAGIHPELIQIAESTWTNLLGMGLGGSVSLTAGLSGTPGFFGGLTGGIGCIQGKAGGGLENSLWIPAGFFAGIRNDISPPFSFYLAGEGGVQYTRFTYAVEGQSVIEGWVPYVQARIGLRYALGPLSLEAGAALGSVFDSVPIPFVRVVLGVVFEVRL